MEKISFAEGWMCYPQDQKNKAEPVSIPHDAMLSEEIKNTSPGGTNTGWYDAKNYVYTKNFFVPEIYRTQKVSFEFEGVYHKTTVFINDIKVMYQHSGYIGFRVYPGEALKYGGNNTIRLEVENNGQPNSRWYTGTGIYRPVWLCISPLQCIEPDGIKITTLDYRTRTIQTDISSSAAGRIVVEIWDDNQILRTIEGESDGKYSTVIELPGAQLWAPEHPKLYKCIVKFGEDIQEVKFGIRTITCNPQEGFCVNGKRRILLGACIHHDNGLLGACAYDFAEERKIRILKQNGYNAIRSAHNPCSKALLNACDELGMLVIDEYTDVWYIHKTKYDYAPEPTLNYKRDLHEIVNKDYNHPSVIMYSTGNEVSETASKKGIRLCRRMTEYLHEEDATRPVTCGINIFFNYLSSIGLGVYSDKKADKQTKDKKNKTVGSEFFNKLAGLLGADFMKFGATLYPCDLKTKDAFACLDVAGYNYGIGRYRHDLKKYPERLILGSETFCEDAYQFYELAENNKNLIGDFVWSGMDYLGELGIGAWEYRDYAPDFSHGTGWRTAGAGRIDLTGKSLAEMTYTRVAFGMEAIGIGVIPVTYTKQKHSPSAWKMTNAVESWSWHGCDGMRAIVEVYARAHHISLYVNDKLVGTKTLHRDCRAVFKTIYYDGEVRAVAYDKAGTVIAEKSLTTAQKETVLLIEPESKSIRRDRELCYVRFRITDKCGILKPLERDQVKVLISGGELLGLGSACPYYPSGYKTDTADTYYGEAMAIIKPGTADTIKIQASCKYGNVQAEVEVIS